MNIEFAKPNWFHRTVKLVAASRLGSFILSHTLHHLDRAVVRATRGRGSLTALLVGLPVLTISARGAKTGKRRDVPLIGLPIGNDIILIASNWGRSFHPAWYRNIMKDPNVTVTYRGLQERYIAREAQGDLLAQSWARAVAVYPGYDAYRKRAGKRQIPVIVLTPSAN
jgi:deazaflavin-dependent oxidoreductase (nitroreductase family)